MYGEPLTVEGSDLLARALQHETDHLDGVLFVERLDAETRRRAMRAIRESEWFASGATAWTPRSGDGPPEESPVGDGLVPTIKVSPHPTRGLAI
jgi:peptide deformylase